MKENCFCSVLVPINVICITICVLQDMFVYVMEYLSNEHFTHLNTADDISGWTTTDIKVLLV